MPSRLPASHDLSFASSIPEDCRTACRAKANLLLVGADRRTREIVRTLWPVSSQRAWRPGTQLALPASAGSTLVLQDVDHLGLNDQKRLLGWLERHPGTAQVVSTSTQPLLRKVESGSFMASLYYRLNILSVDLRTTQQPALVVRPRVERPVFAARA